MHASGHDSWQAQAAETAQRFGAVVSAMSVETFSWAREALNWPYTVSSMRRGC
eukprot:COSAG02_NODE_505_length_20935_cov_38.509119_18_plen_53_part_00